MCVGLGLNQGQLRLKGAGVEFRVYEPLGLMV